MTEVWLLRILEGLAGIALVLVGVCRINAMLGARLTFSVPYIGLTVGAAGVVLGAIWPQHVSEWHEVLLLVSILVLLWDTRGRWTNGPPSDSGSKT